MVSTVFYWDTWLLGKANALVGHLLWLDKTIAYLGVGMVYVVPIILLGLWFYSRYAKQPTLQIILSILLPWQVFNRIFAHFIWFRERPFANSALSVNEVLFHRPDYSFPSDHMTFFAALTAATWLAGYKKLGWVFCIMGIVVGVSRVIVGVHYPLDIIGGIVMGTLGAYIIYWLKGPLTKIFYDPVIKLARKLHLA